MECHLCFHPKPTYYPVYCDCKIQICLECYHELSKSMLCPLCRLRCTGINPQNISSKINVFLKKCIDFIFGLPLPSLMVSLLYVSFCILVVVFCLPIIMLHLGVILFEQQSIKLNQKPVKIPKRSC